MIRFERKTSPRHAMFNKSYKRLTPWAPCPPSERKNVGVKVENRILNMSERKNDISLPLFVSIDSFLGNNLCGCRYKFVVSTNFPSRSIYFIFYFLEILFFANSH